MCCVLRACVWICVCVCQSILNEIKTYPLLLLLLLLLYCFGCLNSLIFPFLAANFTSVFSFSRPYVLQMPPKMFVCTWGVHIEYNCVYEYTNVYTKTRKITNTQIHRICYARTQMFLFILAIILLLTCLSCQILDDATAAIWLNKNAFQNEMCSLNVFIFR